MKQQINQSLSCTYLLDQFFTPLVSVENRQTLVSNLFERTHYKLFREESLILDRFSDVGGVSCCFVRLTSSRAIIIQFTIQEPHIIESCPLGGWLLIPEKKELPFYWIPQAPILRKINGSGHIISESSILMENFRFSSTETFFEVQLDSTSLLDWALWCFPASAWRILGEFKEILTLEKQPIYFWGSRTIFRSAADLFLYLIHGHVYVNDFIWPRKWKFCSELDAYGLYVTLNGLELATSKKLYALLKRQVLFSVIDRQAPDGGWYHGEWTDLIESHYRLHNSAMLLLESALEEQDDDVVREALKRAASFTASRTDKTDLGLWFLHDSLEDSAELMDEMLRQTGSRWIPTRTLGKSPANKMVLNTHLDAIVALDRYRDITGDNQYSQHIASARAATQAILTLHPAEPLYRLLYWAIRLTLLPSSEAKRLPIALRVIRKVTEKYLNRQLHRAKRFFPRFVMPGGLIERHLSPLHFNVGYHPVNILDLTRYLRCFPTKELDDVLNNAVNFVLKNNVPQYWAESKKRHFSLVVWVDALYHLCTSNKDLMYRRYLAEGMMYIDDCGLGLPPSLLGCDAEAISKKNQIPCPSPTDKRLKIANINTRDRIEILIANPTAAERQLVWQGAINLAFSWVRNDGQQIDSNCSPIFVPSRGWLLGEGDSIRSENNI